MIQNILFNSPWKTFNDQHALKSSYNIHNKDTLHIVPVIYKVGWGFQKEDPISDHDNEHMQ